MAVKISEIFFISVGEGTVPDCTAVVNQYKQIISALSHRVEWRSYNKGMSAYQKILTQIERFLEQPHQVILGAEFNDLPEAVVALRCYKAIVDDNYRVEFNLVTPEAQAAFDWRAEITLERLGDDYFRHYLLQATGQVVQAYGRNITPLSTPDETALEQEISWIGTQIRE